MLAHTLTPRITNVSNPPYSPSTHTHRHKIHKEGDLGDINAFGDGPGGDDVVHDSLAERLGDVVQLHELAHAVEHVVVAGEAGVELLEDGGDVAEDEGVQQS